MREMSVREMSGLAVSVVALRSFFSAAGWRRAVATALLVGGVLAAGVNAQAQAVIEIAPDETPLLEGLDLGAPGFVDDGLEVSVPGERVTLRGLDKLTGRYETLEGAVGETIRYERLDIAVRACYARPARRAPESTVFMQIADTKEDPPIMAFSGWMFASSPALSAMDHPRYDVWVLSCSTS